MGDSQEYIDLSKHYHKLQLELESTNQHLHECRNSMKAYESREAYYEEEIKVLEAKHKEEQRKIAAKVQELEETIHNIRTMYHESLDNLKKQLADKDGEVTDLKSELEDVTKIAQVCGVHDNDTTADEIFQLKEENFKLVTQLTDLETRLGQSEKERISLEETVVRWTTELEDYKENLKCKNEELKEAKMCIQQLNDKNLCLQTEIDAVKSQPLDNQSRGNSLFAEVDDRRQQLQDNMKKMKTRYVEMKNENSSLLKQISTLRAEKSSLLAQWEAEVKGKEEDEYAIAACYKNQIKDLNEIVQSYKRELEQKPIVPPSNYEGTKYLSLKLAEKEKEIEDLRQKFKNTSLKLTSFSMDMAVANRENRSLNLEILQLKNEIGKLKVEIEERKMLSPTEKKVPEAIPVLKPALKGDREANKENTVKDVQFSECTVEPQVTDRNKYRRGAKVMVMKK